ncbi:MULTISPECIES: SDR family oxidoreductase [Corynebacterium]|uniref:SDR family oxidoreductase n=1 Tax=Corynebacterium aurimucosum TaxID=169292 RepID=A0A558ING8_9CORY|nr:MULTISPECIES: SDR family oxidoreductase [Corynebacterium]OFK66568.1 short chain dehydrogenase [Corynebacterium sp. HMSC074A09]OFN34336.1 short chain dehydrogenase [Corynebacterium sp. HMSC072A04]OFN79377.1 short chain dehydrogenase [Corynebacterium sp. HMSC070E08]OFO17963.1 short chain dehydrogenase [Corynebacterium sp. HMSC056F09]OFP29457.1 short chain dehydrogenase [Corynebacterium sp. HMSC068G04]
MVKTAVVTGATGGMGAEIIKDLARDHRVYALGRRAGELPEAENIVPVEIDLLSLLDGAALPTELASLERVDVLVHAAARADKRSVESARPEDWRAQMDLNVHVPAELTRQLLPALRAAEGLVVFINSGAGIHSYGDNVIYAATKHALYALADGLRLGELGIRVSTVAPGPTDTPMLQGLQDYNPEHVIAPVEVAKAIRATVDAGPTTQLTEIRVRPRIELNQRK